MICQYCDEEIKVEHYSYRQCLKSKEYKIRQLQSEIEALRLSAPMAVLDLERCRAKVGAFQNIINSLECRLADKDN